MISSDAKIQYAYSGHSKARLKNIERVNPSARLVKPKLFRMCSMSNISLICSTLSGEFGKAIRRALLHVLSTDLNEMFAILALKIIKTSKDSRKMTDSDPKMASVYNER